MSLLIDERILDGISTGRAPLAARGARAHTRALVALLVLLGIAALVGAALASRSGYVPDHRPAVERTITAPGDPADHC